MTMLERIRKPGDIKKLKKKDYERLAQEIRNFLIEKISVTGGHLASNLGVVELTMALHLAFDPPKDRIVWDVGHQAYTHKLLTGRKDDFDELRTYGGMSGFPKRRESDCDAFDTGHSSTSISAGLGLVEARDLAGEDYAVISVIGDGALTGGMAYEALNNASRLKTNFIIILNDNNMSISENIGGISKHLNSIRSAIPYNKLKQSTESTLSKVPVVGDSLIRQIVKTKSLIKQVFLPGMLFENMGITYWGPLDGHNIEGLSRVLHEARHIRRAVVIHVLTQKGRGYGPAEENPARFHGVEPFEISTGLPKKKKEGESYTDIAGKTLVELGGKYPSMVAVTAAMPDGTGLTPFSQAYPDRFFDVGIAEAHAVTFAAGMAAGGLKPVVAVYSSFLQRAYDQILHDVCIQELPVVFAVDRAGLVGSDGETHQGIFDLSFLSSIPNMSVIAPKNGWELQAAFRYAMDYEGPIAIRYPRGQAFMGLKAYQAPFVHGKSEVLFRGGEVALLAVGSMVETACQVRELLLEEGINASVVNVRFVKPLDTDMLNDLAVDHSLYVTMEENVLRGGFGEAVGRHLNQMEIWSQGQSRIRTQCLPENQAGQRLRVQNRPDLLCIGIPDMYVEHGNVDILKREVGIDQDGVFEKICRRLQLNADER